MKKKTRKSEPDDIWRIRRALKVYAGYLDNVFEDKHFGDAYRDIATRLKYENNEKIRQD